MSVLKETDPLLKSAGKRAPFMTEKLTVHQHFWQRCTIYGDVLEL